MIMAVLSIVLVLVAVPLAFVALACIVTVVCELRDEREQLREAAR